MNIPMKPLLVATLCLGAFAPAALAQKLPPPSRTVFKCGADGKTYYSDSPCMGAKRIDVEPTRGVSKLSGSERVGSDVRNEIWHEQLADAVQPITGMDARQFDKASRRTRLSAEAQRECRYLDGRIAETEQLETHTAKDARTSIQATLYEQRTRYRKLGC